jgi:hypothetical protein
MILLAPEEEVAVLMKVSAELAPVRVENVSF